MGKWELLRKNLYLCSQIAIIINHHFVYCREAICGLDIKYYVVNGCLL